MTDSPSGYSDLGGLSDCYDSDEDLQVVATAEFTEGETSGRPPQSEPGASEDPTLSPEKLTTGASETTTAADVEAGANALTRLHTSTTRPADLSSEAGGLPTRSEASTATGRARARIPRSPWLPPPTPRHASTPSKPRTPRNLGQIPEPMGLVEPTWLPYSLPLPGKLKTNTKSSHFSSQGSTPLSSPRALKRSLERHQKTRQSQWNSRHCVCDSKDNRRLPRLQRSYFDDMPFSRYAVPSHGARNFDLFCSTTSRDQVRELQLRFQRYPFLEAQASENEVGQHEISAFGYQQLNRQCSSDGSPDIKSQCSSPKSELAELSRPGSPHGAEECAALKPMSDILDVEDMAKRKFANKACDRTRMAQYSILATGGIRQFQGWANSKFGGLCRLWRCIDLQNHMRIGQGEFLRRLRDLGYSGDGRELFRLLNRDQTGTLLFYHFAPEPALAVAEFLQWIRENHGSMAQIGVTDVLDKRGNMHRGKFIQLCKKRGFCNEDALNLAFDLLDKDGSGTIVKDELDLLDEWDFPEWLTSKPDVEAADHVLQRFKERFHGNALQAWRHLDRNGTMRVAWHDFRQACRKLMAREDCESLPAAWRVLDDDLSGWLSLREFDATAYDQLTSLVNWATATFGDMLGAFPKLLSGSTDVYITPVEFRHVCKACGLGDNIVMEIFQGLDVDNTGSITLHEIRFLNSWKIASDKKEEEAWAALTGTGSKATRSRRSVLGRQSLLQGGRL